MTPKEKAEEIFNKYYQIVADASSPEYNAKKCALIAVDEMILYIYKYSEMQFLTNWGNILKYWKEVKQEIENL